MRIALIGALAIMTSGCETGYSMTEPRPQTSNSVVFQAVLRDGMSNETRDMIRSYVRDVAGPDYIVDPDQLLRSDTLIATDRGRSQSLGPVRLVPDREFRLEYIRDGEWASCRLLSDKDDDAFLEMLDSEVCKILPPDHLG